MDLNVFWTAIGAVGGVFGAIAAILTVIITFRQVLYNDIKKLRLEFNCGKNNAVGNELIGLDVTNVGRRAVIIDDWGFEITNGEVYSLKCSDKLPKKLSADNKRFLGYSKCDFFSIIKECLYDNTLKQNKKMIFYVTDSVGKRYKIKSAVTVVEMIKAMNK